MADHRSSIAAVLIVRDEARCVARCLGSVAPWVDRMVVLDTGSRDDTIAIARACGAEVHDTVWPDSFAEARNAALALADADWNLVIDADEWIQRGGECLREWCAGPPRLGRVRIVSEASGGGATRNRITRLLPRSARFVGRVHEQVKSDLPRVDIDL
ncbi:MAG: glycosyltransferase, partial [Proteobacteria bacterium]|nr:glycosyltransferase [Pseudomonadota bacterium]